MLVLLPKGLIDLLDKLRLSYLIGRGLGRGRDRVMLLVLGGGGMDERSYYGNSRLFRLLRNNFVTFNERLHK